MDVHTANSSFQGDLYSSERLSVPAAKAFEAWEDDCPLKMVESPRGLTELFFGLPGGWDCIKTKPQSGKWLYISPFEGSYLQQKYQKAKEEAIYFCNMVLYINFFQFILQ